MLILCFLDLLSGPVSLECSIYLLFGDRFKVREDGSVPIDSYNCIAPLLYEEMLQLCLVSLLEEIELRNSLVEDFECIDSFFLLEFSTKGLGNLVFFARVALKIDSK